MLATRRFVRATRRILRIGREGDLAVYFAYDAIDRLTSETWRRRSDNGQIYGFWYAYDAANNRLAMRREAATGTQTEAAYYAYNAANELTQRKVWTPGDGWVDTYYVYDANGALVREWEPTGPATTYYEYAHNQLVSKIVPSSGPEVVFGYDARLNRYAVVTGGTPVYFNWDGLNPLEQRLGNGTLVARYTHGRSRLPGIGTGVEVERVASGTTYYQFPCFDLRGTAYAVTDENESVQLNYAQDAFGRELAAPGGTDPAVPNDLIYQTNWLTLNIGGKSYQLSRYRLYMAELGIFLSRDFLPYRNKYRAWSNYPVGQVDKDGRESTELTELGQRLAEQIERQADVVDEASDAVDRAIQQFGEGSPEAKQSVESLDYNKELLEDLKKRSVAEEAAAKARRAKGQPPNLVAKNPISLILADNSELDGKLRDCLLQVLGIKGLGFIGGVGFDKGFRAFLESLKDPKYLPLRQFLQKQSARFLGTNLYTVGVSLILLAYAFKVCADECIAEEQRKREQVSIDRMKLLKQLRAEIVRQQNLAREKRDKEHASRRTREYVERLAGQYEKTINSNENASNQGDKLLDQLREVIDEAIENQIDPKVLFEGQKFNGK